MTTLAKVGVGVRAATLVAAAALAACGAVKRPDGGTGLLPVGAVAPEVVGTDPAGKTVRLSDVRGSAAVVYFYPKDGTPGCTTEACAFRDAFKSYEAKHVVLFGVSRDSADSHAKFAASHSLPFPLVADQDGSVSLAYGVSSTLGFDSRVTFLVGADGKIAHVWPNVDPGVHASEVLAAATTTQ
jgi:thioredoxin-dependent peroxiredoxin